MIVSLAFGAGTNSTAIITGWVEKQLPPMDCIIFADTGGELPETYEHVHNMSQFCSKHGLPSIQIVSRTVRGVTAPPLEQDLLLKSNLPPVVFGFKTCSQKFKIVPQDRFLKRTYPKEFKNKLITKLIGYDFAESRRWMKASLMDLDNFYLQFPLVDWEWARPECIASIKRMGLQQPGKTSCFFCPNMRKAEILSLAHAHPGLFNRAITLESKALQSGKIKSSAIKGLGRSFSWASLSQGSTDVIDGTDDSASVCGYCTDFEP